MAEAYVCAHEAGVARLDRFDAGGVFREVCDKVARKDFFGQRHRPRRGRDRRNLHAALQAGDVEREQPAIFDDLPGDLVFAFGKLGERNFFAILDATDEIEIGRSQQAEVLAVLPIDALDVFGDDTAEAGGDFGIRRLLAARPFAAPLAGDRNDEAAAFDVTLLDGKLVAAFQSEVDEFPQAFVEVIADVSRGDLVCRDVVAQRRNL